MKRGSKDTGDGEQPKLFVKPPYKNLGLFADHFLETRLRDLARWQSDEGVEAAHDAIRILFDDRAVRLDDHTNEAQTEHELIQPMLDILWGEDSYRVQVPIPSASGHRQPDYGFFLAPQDRDSAQSRYGTAEYFESMPCLGDAKRWAASLDKTRGADDNPSAQISNYLLLSGVRWGILTNGQVWRLYEREKSKSGGVYYEVNLIDVLRRNDMAQFKHFYCFFSRTGLAPDPDGKTFLARVFDGSIEYATEVGDGLKDSVYDALRHLMNGFLDHTSNELDGRDADTLRAVHENSLILLYRLLFILFAEHRGLLPLEDDHYYEYSLRRLQEQTNRRLRTGRDSCLGTMTTLWSQLCGLFRLIDEGHRAGDRVIVPAYNGGLFALDVHPHVAHTARPDAPARWEIGDPSLAETIDLLGYARDRWDQPGSSHVDYATLEVQHLGSIYEGLLELRPRVAEQELVEIIQKGKPVFKRASEAPSSEPVRGKPPHVVQAGDVYLATDKGERKATGSYYTPKYIVDYIVEHTIGPLAIDAAQQVATKRDKVDQEIKRLETRKRQFANDPTEVRKADRDVERARLSLLEPYLSLRILDPAMGSGHFLVGAADYLSLAMATDPNLPEVADAEDQDPQAYFKRLVVERCLYGVDLNPLAVELTKLSLWLHTVSNEKALSFLDHHLRCGNSLIGAWIADLAAPPVVKRRGRKPEPEGHQTALFDTSHVEREAALMLTFLRRISEMPSDEATDVHEKATIFERLEREHKETWRRVANLWAAGHFGVTLSRNEYFALADALARRRESELTPALQRLLDACDAVDKDKRFFHWELEFPDAFLNDHGGLSPDEAGFDAVIGNPPYDVVSAREQKRDVDDDKAYYRQCAALKPGIGSKLNLYRLFCAQGLHLTKRRGRQSYIVPMSLLADAQARPLRADLLHHRGLCTVEAFPQKDDRRRRVFPDAKLPTCLYVADNGPPGALDVRVHPGRDIAPMSTRLSLTLPDLVRFDPENLGIPASPAVTPAGFALALRMKEASEDSFLGEFAPSQQGEVNLTSDAEFLTADPAGPVVLRGAHVGRYAMHEVPKQGEQRYLHVHRFLAGRRPGTKAFDHRHVRIGYQRGAALDNWRRLIAAPVTPGGFCSDTINYIVASASLSLDVVLALLNSSLWEWRFRLSSTNNHVNAYEIDAMPLPRPSSDAPADYTKQIARDARSVYRQGLDSGNLSLLAELVADRLLPSRHPRAALYDLLAFLGREMVELTARREAETDAFTGWLGRFVGARLSDLAGQTAIREYASKDFGALVAVLSRNRDRLAIDPAVRSRQVDIQREFDVSVAKVGALTRHRSLTDHLIDQVVYHLYGLTDDDVRIVEAETPAAYEDWQAWSRVFTPLSPGSHPPSFQAAARVSCDTAHAGNRLQANDAWIAATALQHGLPLVTHDGDFGGVNGLEVISEVDER